MPRRNKGEGGIYQRDSDRRWVGVVEAGFEHRPDGTSRRVRRTVTAATRRELLPKFERLKAEVAAGLATVGFTVYVANFASYNATYGIIGSVIVLLLGLWIINTVLLFGAEIDAEIERGRQLQGGIEAEETIMLPPRDTRAAKKLADKHGRLVAEGEELRLEHGGDHSLTG